MVVVRQLPETRETLLLRLLGGKAVRRRALGQLRALPADAWEHRLAESILVAFRAQIDQDPTEASEEMQAYLREIETVYNEVRERFQDEGRAGGLRDALLRLYSLRLGPVPTELRAALEAERDSERLDGWLELFATGSAEAIRAAVCHSEPSV